MQFRRPAFDPWVRESPWRREWQPTPLFLPGKPHEQRSLASCSPWGHKRVGHNWATNAFFFFFWLETGLGVKKPRYLRNSAFISSESLNSKKSSDFYVYLSIWTSTHTWASESMRRGFTQLRLKIFLDTYSLSQAPNIRVSLKIIYRANVLVQKRAISLWLPSSRNCCSFNFKSTQEWMDVVFRKGGDYLIVPNTNISLMVSGSRWGKITASLMQCLRVNIWQKKKNPTIL